jgi:tRNA threonylcarbamoyladenosine biosynthesis protein TsaE
MMQPLRHTTRSPEETIAFGRSLASRLAPPAMILLTGDLGAGKTTLVKGIAEGFQAALRDDVTSPTFTLVHEYRGPAVTVYHIDLYRIETERELATLALDDLRGPASLLLVEWGEKFPGLREEADARLVIERAGESERLLRLEPRGSAAPAP